MTRIALRAKLGRMSSDERSTREAAGRWLRKKRQSRGFDTVGSFALAIGVDTSRVSSYETGRSSVPDDRAEQIARVLRMDIIDVRRNLGLWTPPETAEEALESTPDLSWEELHELLAQAETDGDELIFGALMLVKQLWDERNRPRDEPRERRGREAG